jgi:hypothetical protein
MNTSAFFRLLDSADKGADLARSIKCISVGDATPFVYFVEPLRFGVVPGSPFAYWVTDAVRELFQALPRFENEGRTVKQGMATGQDFRFVRAAWEVPPASRLNAAGENWCDPASFQARCVSQSQAGVRWFTFAKGGEYLPFYADLSLVGNWQNDGAEIRNFFDPQTGKLSSRPQSIGFYFRAGYTYPLRTSRLCPQAMPAGTLISVRGSGIFGDTTGKFLALLASRPFDYLIKMMLGWASRPQFDMGDINITPVPEILEVDGERLASLALQIVRAKRDQDTVAEETHVFIRPSASLSLAATLGFNAVDWSQRIQVSTGKVAGLQAEIDEIAFSLYSIQGIDRKAMEVGSDAEVIEESSEEPEDVATDVDVGSSFAVAEQMVSYALGVAFGRWDLRYATGEQAAPELPDPFAPLPVCPPGQLQNAQGLPARPEDVPAAYPVRIPWDGILVDDSSHPLDLERRVREVIDIIWNGKEVGPNADAIKHEACDILGVKTLRDFFRKPAGFFANHLSRYSKSRRQAPIYWQLSAGNGNYSAWLYYHRFTQDTLYRVLGDFVEIRIQEAEREQFEFESQGGLSGDAASLLQEAQTLLQDLRLFKSELELVAPLWNPNLNDGVIINHAILWRITPYTPWQKKCKECWGKLVKGDYDWARLAFHLWPERVIRKCVTDRSLAIAHGLEERLWQETNNGNWLQCQVSEAELQALLAEYSKPAVQNALERFLAAPPPVAAARTRAPRATKSSSTGTTRRPRGSAPEVDAETSRQTLLVLTAAPAEGLGRNAIAELLGVEAASLTAVIKQLKEGGQIEQLGAARGAKYRLTESGLASVESQAGEGE